MHLLSTLFSKRSLPFYKFGEVFYLQKIPTNYWVEYICSRFSVTGKQISESLANEICNLVDNHSSYVQQLSWLVWTKTESTVTVDFLKEAVEDLLNQNSIRYCKETEHLTSYQLNFLRALVNGVHEGFTTQKVLRTYKLGTSANITRIKKSLEDKELIDISGKKVSIADPVFALWLRRVRGF